MDTSFIVKALWSGDKGTGSAENSYHIRFEATIFRRACLQG